MPRPQQWSQLSLPRGGRQELSGGLHQACEALACQRLSLEGGTNRQKRSRGVSDAVEWFLWKWGAGTFSQSGAWGSLDKEGRWSEPVSRISCACSFAPGKWFGKEELCLKMPSGYHQGCAPGLCLVRIFPFSSFMGMGKSKALSYTHCYSFSQCCLAGVELYPFWGRTHSQSCCENWDVPPTVWKSVSAAQHPPGAGLGKK